MAFDPNVLANNAVDLLINVGIFVAVIVIGLLAGYLIGSLIAAIVRRILNIRELKEQIAGSEILSLSFWGKLVTGTSVYIKWLFVAIGLRALVDWAVKSELGNTAMFEVLTGYAEGFQELMIALGIFLVFAVVGVVIGAIVYKIIKAALDSVRVEERMAKHCLHDALGGLQLTKVIAGIFMIYVIIVLLGSGIDAVAVRMGEGFEEVRLVVMFRSLVNLYPEFVLGGFIIIAGALVGDFMQERVRNSKTSLASESVGWLVQTMVIFFAIVLALPHFQIRENVDILTDSFKIVVAGISIGLAIAMGLGLKDVFAHWGKKIEKKL
jgi:hypothetical protein